MQITIEHMTAKAGMFKTAPAIQLSVQFSNVERAIIDSAGLANYDFFDGPPNPHLSEDMQGPTKVRMLWEKKGPLLFYYFDLAAARNDEPRLKEALKKLKGAIDGNAAPLESKQTFEL